MSQSGATNPYVTSDLYLAAFIQVHGLPMRASRVPNTTRWAFSFDCTGYDIEAITASWYDNSGLVSGQLYASATKNLKTMVHPK